MGCKKIIKLLIIKEVEYMPEKKHYSSGPTHNAHEQPKRQK